MHGVVCIKSLGVSRYYDQVSKSDCKFNGEWKCGAWSIVLFQFRAVANSINHLVWC
jgi:hypothetical protein